MIRWTSHLLMMLRTHLLLMMLRVHHLLLMHLLLIHPMLIHGVLIHAMLVHRILAVSGISMFGHFVVVRVVCPNILIVAMHIFSFVFVPLILARMLVRMFLAIHSCSLRMLVTGHVSSFILSFS